MARKIKNTPAASQSDVAKMPSGAQKRKRRMGWRQSCRNSMARIQRSSRLQLPKTTVGRVVRETLQGETQRWGTSGYRITAEALEAIRHALEAYGTEVLSEADLLAEHANRHTIKIKDLHAAVKRTPGADLSDVLRESSERKSMARCAGPASTSRTV